MRRLTRVRKLLRSSVYSVGNVFLLCYCPAVFLSKASGRIGRMMLEFIFSADVSCKQCFFIHVGSFLSLQAKHNMSARIGTIGRSGLFPRNKTKMILCLIFSVYKEYESISYCTAVFMHKAVHCFCSDIFNIQLLFEQIKNRNEKK